MELRRVHIRTGGERRRDIGRTASDEDARSGRSAWHGRHAEHRRHRGGLLDAAPSAAQRLDTGTRPAALERDLLKPGRALAHVTRSLFAGSLKLPLLYRSEEHTYDRPSLLRNS